MKILSALFLLSLSLMVLDVESFTISLATRLTGNKINDSVLFTKSSITIHNNKASSLLMAEDNNNNGVVELVDDEETTEASPTSVTNNGGSAPTFLSQGEIDKEALELTNDPKQTRVIIYIILSLIPVLFLIPLMLGSRDLIPMDALPPVEM